MDDDTYTQCVLIQKNKEGELHTTSWIPSSFAKVGRVLRLKNDDDVWEDGWVVAEAGTVKSADYVLDHERDFKRQRKASDI